MRNKKIAFGCCSILFLIGIVAVKSMAHGWMAPEEAAEIQNPVASNEKSAARGKETYLQNCAACHGDNIEGMNAQEVGLEKDTPNLKERLKIHNDGDFFWKIQEGKGDMPSFREDLPDNQIWDAINYIREEAE